MMRLPGINPENELDAQINDVWIRLVNWYGCKAKKPEDFEKECGIKYEDFRQSPVWIGWRAWVLRGYKNSPEASPAEMGKSLEQAISEWKEFMLGGRK